ncbi:MAG: hypothetical protein LLG02_00165 [Pelosinus sp.]|nr:hypothetical protein [Pelosinus sp.]
MSIMKSILAYRYTKKNIDLCDSINIELDERQSMLENIGFKVKRSEHMVNYEPALILRAEKNNLVLKVTRFLQGRRDLSLVIKNGKRETTLPLYPSKFDEAIAIVNAAQ